jgi:anti-anti-sigma factor
MDMRMEQNTAIVSVPQDLDGRSLCALQDAFDRVFANHPERVVIEYQDGDRMHSLTISAFIWAFKRCRSEAIPFALVADGPQINSVLATTRLPSLFPCYRDLATAVA